MDHAETLAAIEVHGRRSEESANRAREDAQKARDHAQALAAMHTDPGHKAAVLEGGEREAKGHEARAARHQQHADTARAGYLLDGPEERGDSNYALRNRDLRGACAKHGLMTSTPRKSP